MFSFLAIDHLHWFDYIFIDRLGVPYNVLVMMS